MRRVSEKLSQLLRLHIYIFLYSNNDQILSFYAIGDFRSILSFNPPAWRLLLKRSF